MVQEFLTQAEDAEFKSWLDQHTNGFYLNERQQGNIKRGSGEMVLHKVGCFHLGKGEGVISTTFAKAASDDRDSLMTWAQERQLTVAPCSSCKPN